MKIQRYQDLIVWQKAMDLTVLIYKITIKLPKEEIYSLTNQMRRSAVSIPSNIAEGQVRNSTKEYIQFLRIAQGSRAELETQILICQKIGYLSDVDIFDIINLTEEIGKMISSMIVKLKNKDG